MPNTAAIWAAWEEEEWLHVGSTPAPRGGGSPSSPVTFPAVPLRNRVYIAVGADLTKDPSQWSWVDITSYVRFSAGITTRQGRQDWMSTVQTSSGQLTLDNRDGYFSRRNPNSPYFGLLTFNTPIWATVDPGSGPVSRMALFVNEWPTRWDRSGKDSYVPIQCAGIMRRLAQGSVLKSAMRRRVLSSDEPTPAGYWPMEDADGATQVASGLPGGIPMTGGGALVMGLAFGGSAGGVDVGSTTDGAVQATVPLASAAGFSLEYMAVADSVPTSPMIEIISGTFDATHGTGSFSDGNPHHVAFLHTQNGSNVDFVSYVDGAFNSSGSVVGATLASSVTVKVRNSGVTGSELAHAAIYDFADMNAPTTRAAAVNGYAGELATTRIRRLAAEEGVPMVCTSGVSQAMGAQGEDTFLNLLRDCETVDGGVLYEVNWGLGFQALNDRCNEPVSLALDFNQRHIAVEPQPADDDQRLRNRWTVSRTGGSKGVTAERTTGPTGTQAGGPGLYDDSLTVNAHSDDQLPNIAGWLLHMSS